MVQKKNLHYAVWSQSFMLSRQVLYHLSHSASPFSVGYFQDRISRTICPGWLPTTILLISASWVELPAWATGSQLSEQLLQWQNQVEVVVTRRILVVVIRNRTSFAKRKTLSFLASKDFITLEDDCVTKHINLKQAEWTEAREKSKLGSTYHQEPLIFLFRGHLLQNTWMLSDPFTYTFFYTNQCSCTH
jgi:hypothetical protein